MKTKTPKTIRWAKSKVLSNVLYGFINDKAWFEIQKKGIRKPKHVLLSYSIQSEFLPKVNKSKKVYTHESLSMTKEIAQSIFNEFVKDLLR